MSPYIAPGLGLELRLDESVIINLINKEFGFIGTEWIKQKYGRREYSVARQLLMVCTGEFLGYTYRRSAEMCDQNFTNAFHSKTTILDTYWYDREYMDRVRHVYNRCKEIVRGLGK